MTDHELYGGKTRIWSYLEPERADEFREVADRLGVSMAEMVRRILEEFLESGDVSGWLEEERS